MKKHRLKVSMNESNSSSHIGTMLGLLFVAGLIIVNFAVVKDDPPPEPLPVSSSYNPDQISLDENGIPAIVTAPKEDFENVIPENSFDPFTRELEDIDIGAIYWSASNPVVRINKVLRKLGDVIETKGGTYQVLGIERNVVYLIDPDGTTVKFNANVTPGIRPENMDRRRDNLERRFDFPD